MDVQGSYETGDGTVHVVGAPTTACVLAALAERAVALGGPVPLGVTEGDLVRSWVRPVRLAGEISFANCGSGHPEALLMTSWRPR